MPPKKRDDKRGGDDGGYEGVGVYVYPDGSRYDGQVVRKEGLPPKRHGNGVYVDVNSVYDGQWIDDCMGGEGHITFSGGASYRGTFHANVFEGRGRYEWPNGTSYEGEWRRNLMHGVGVFTDDKGQKWSGRFYNGSGVEVVPVQEA